MKKMREQGWEKFNIIMAAIVGTLMLPGAIAFGIYLGLYVFCSACQMKTIIYSIAIVATIAPTIIIILVYHNIL